MMKIAICYDNIITRGGHERAVLTLSKAFNADIYTINYTPDSTFPEFRRLKVHSNELKYNIFGLKLLQTIHTFRNKDLSDYDLIISNGGWSRQIAVGEQNPPTVDYNPGVPGFCKYMGTGFLFRPWLRYIQELDRRSAREVDVLIANSCYVRNVFKRFYRRDTEVIYPPIDIHEFRNKYPEDFFLSVQRISPQKRIELQIEIFKNLPKERLIILGPVDDQVYFDKLKQNIPGNIEFVLDDTDLIDYYSRCKGVILTSKGEPFGMVPVEAMASGKPCIAVNEGGFKETIVDERTGYLIDPPYPDNFEKTIKNFDSYSFDPGICKEKAKEFSEEIFIEKMKNTIDCLMAEK